MEKLTKEQLTEALGVLISKVDRINERTKVLTIKDRERKNEIKALEKKLNEIADNRTYRKNERTI